MNYENFVKLLDEKKYKLNEPIAKHSTVKIGGPADIWYEATDTEDFINVIKLAKENNVPITVFGWGSNTLVGDKGIRGLVVRNMSREIKIGDEVGVKETENVQSDIDSRWQSDANQGTFRGVEFKDLDYDESTFPRIEVTMDSGVDLPFAINYLLNKGVTGLQWYARIPGTIGGAIYNNIHGGTHYMHEIVKSVRILDENLEIKVLENEDLENNYDESRFHRTKEIILDVTFELFKGDAEKGKYVAQEWTRRKSLQPSVSLGSVFANISNEDKERLGYPTTSIGYIVEHVLKMTSFRIGDAMISPNHHNFIENVGNATAADYLAVIDEIKKRTKEKTGLEIRTEIFLLGEF